MNDVREAFVQRESCVRQARNGAGPDRPKVPQFAAEGAGDNSRFSVLVESVAVVKASETMLPPTRGW